MLEIITRDSIVIDTRAVILEKLKKMVDIREFSIVPVILHRLAPNFFVIHENGIFYDSWKKSFFVIREIGFFGIREIGVFCHSWVFDLILWFVQFVHRASPPPCA